MQTTISIHHYTKLLLPELSLLFIFSYLLSYIFIFYIILFSNNKRFKIIVKRLKNVFLKTFLCYHIKAEKSILCNHYWSFFCNSYCVFKMTRYFSIGSHKTSIFFFFYSSVIKSHHWFYCYNHSLFQF